MPSTLMQIICPNCDTCYGVDAATFPAAGRAVRCARCQQVWTAHPETADAFEAESPEDTAVAEAGTPSIDSPSIADGNPPGWDIDTSDRPAPQEALADIEDNATATARPARRAPLIGTLLARLPSPTNWLRRRTPVRAAPAPKLRLRKSAPISFKLPAFIAGLGAVLAGLIIWRADVVRLMPQTAISYRLIGLPVNLRGIAFQDMKIRTESVDGAPVMVIEGNLVGVAKRPVEIPRLRFIVRDGNGTEIYAWNAVLEQAVLKTGDTVAFRSRLASPPAEARNIEVRFFNRRDLARGAV